MSATTVGSPGPARDLARRPAARPAPAPVNTIVKVLLRRWPP